MIGDERVEGTWRPIFIHNGGLYHLADLKIYADGMIDCWCPVTLDEFRRKVASGWVTTQIPPSGRASAHHLGSWTVAEQTYHLDGVALIGEVSDEIDRLAGRPTTSERCLAIRTLPRRARHLPRQPR